MNTVKETRLSRHGSWLMAQFTQAQNSEWKSVAGRAKKLLATL
jgi:hypothetical protein